MNEYRITADLEKLFGEEMKLGRFQEYLTCTIGDNEPIVIGKIVKRKEKKAKPGELGVGLHHDPLPQGI